MAAIEVEALTRSYGRQSTRRLFRRNAAQPTVRQALKGISFAVAEGETFGLLGPNGAGKSTTIKILATLLTPTSGRAIVVGSDVVQEPHRVRRSIGYVAGGDRGLYERLSAYDNLRYFAELYGIAPKEQRSRLQEVLEAVDLDDRRHDRVEKFSRGMRQRLHIARGLLNHPRVLFLDEPTIGLDPEAARQLRTTVSGLAERGVTLLLTTHYMHEADALCDRIGIISEGEMVALDTPAGLKALVSQRSAITVEVRAFDSRLEAAVRRLTGVHAVLAEERSASFTVRVQVEPSADVMPPLLAVLGEASILRVDSGEATLEDAYMEMVSAAKPRERALR